MAAALALGLGSRDLVAQIIAGIYVRELYQPGDDIAVGDVEGGEIEQLERTHGEIRRFAIALLNGVVV